MTYTTQEYAEAGHRANLEGKVRRIVDGKIVLADRESPTLEEAKTAVMVEINRIYEEKAFAVRSDTPNSEVQTWLIQQKEWEAWQADGNTPTPFVDGLAEARQMGRLELLGKIGGKVAAFQEYMSRLTGLRQRFEDRIKAAATVGEVEAVQWIE